MAGILSLEYFESLMNVPNGWVTLDAEGYIDPSAIHPSAVESFKGIFGSLDNLKEAHPTGSLADYAYIQNSFWYWNSFSNPKGWCNQLITATAYSNLPALEKTCIPWIIIPAE